YLEFLNDALKAYDNSERYALKANNITLLVEIKLLKGELYYYVRQYVLAKKIFQEAFLLAKSKSMEKEQHDAQVRIADLLITAGKYKKAREIYHKFIDYMSNNDNLLELAYWIGKLAGVYKLEGNYDLAKEYFYNAANIAAKAGSKSYNAWYLHEIANIDLIEWNLDESIQKYRSILEIAIEQKNTLMLSHIYQGLGDAYIKTGNLPDAILNYTHAINIIEDKRENLRVDQLRIGYFFKSYEIYQNLALCFLERYEAEKDKNDLDSL
ncbi:MAG: tetratricopeptide repeat protein, partial [bacterium]